MDLIDCTDDTWWHYEFAQRTEARTASRVSVALDTLTLLPYAQIQDAVVMPLAQALPVILVRFLFYAHSAVTARLEYTDTCMIPPAALIEFSLISMHIGGSYYLPIRAMGVANTPPNWKIQTKTSEIYHQARRTCVNTTSSMTSIRPQVMKK